jgi:purine-binding chemotaxis protein CheW
MKTAHPPVSTPIDWKEVHRTLRGIRKSLDNAFAPNAAQTRRILAQRARLYAARDDHHQGGLDSNSYMQVRIGGETAGIILSDLQAVAPYTGSTPLPGSVPEILGITSARGVIWTVLDLHLLLGQSGAGRPESGYALLLRHKDRRIALHVDAIDRILPWRESDLQSPDTAADARFSMGLLPGGVTLLNTMAMYSYLNAGEPD